MGKISFVEGLIMILGILWLFGFFRGFVIPVTFRSTTAPQPSEKKEVDQKPVAKKKYGDNDSEYVEYEEVK